MKNQWIQEVERKYKKKSLPMLNPGDTVKVKIKIKEGNKERLQAYEGVIIKLRGEGTSQSMTVRRIFQGVGVERVFLLHSPNVDSIQVMKRGEVNRSKLYYMRQRSGKSARIKEKLGAALAKVQSAEKTRQAKLDAQFAAEEASRPVEPEAQPEVVAQIEETSVVPEAAVENTESTPEA